MTTWPSASKASTSNLDSGSDKPRLARADIKQNVDNVNDIIDMFNIDSPLDKQYLAYDGATQKFQLSQSLNTQGIQIDDNNIIATRSNDDINISASGSGEINTQSLLNLETTYREKVNTLTSSSSISVDCNLASIHTVTLGHNTAFSFSNLEAGKSVTLVIKQDATGSRTATFSTAVFPFGQKTLSTNPNTVDMVVIFNDGIRLMGTLAKAFS